jgi:hypothetical protein
MSKSLSVAWLLLAGVALVGAAWMFRYEPTPAGDAMRLWDRWYQRACVVAPLKGMACTTEELQRLRQPDPAK